MPSITVLGEDGGIVRQEVLSRNIAIYGGTDDDTEVEELNPSVVQRVEYDHSGQTSSITSVCGDTENRRESDEQPDITVEGVIIEEELNDIKGLKNRDEITLVSDVHSGPVYVKRVTIEQNTDVIHYIPDDSNEEKLAFVFQLQLGQ